MDGQQTYSNLGFAKLFHQVVKKLQLPQQLHSFLKQTTAPDLTKQSEAYGRLMQQKFEEAYGNTRRSYKAEAATLGMPLECIWIIL